MEKKELLKDLLKYGFEIITIENEKRNFKEQDNELIEDMEKLNCNILLHHNSMARNWYFTNSDTLYNYFNNGGIVSYENANQKLA